MGVRGKKSAASMLNVVQATNQRMQPPDDLDAAERAEWLSIVDSLPPDYFRPADVALLALFCMCNAFCKEAARQMKADGIVLKGPPKFNKDGDIVGHDRDYAHPAAGILAANASALATMAVKLRLCPSSRYNEKVASTKTARGSVNAKPWEFTGGGSK